MSEAFGALGVIPTLTVDKTTFTDLTNLIILYADIANAGPYATFRRGTSNTGYQVTAGKTLMIQALSFNCFTATSSAINLGYSDDDIGFQSATAPVTNPLWIAGGASESVTFITKLATTASIFVVEKSLGLISIPQNKYVQIYDAIATGSGTLDIQLYGYEV